VLPRALHGEPFRAHRDPRAVLALRAAAPALFGDLHVHTSFSFDSSITSQRNDPAAAYRYAKGEPIPLPDENGAQTLTALVQPRSRARRRA
jgi:hypothetical protein